MQLPLFVIGITYLLIPPLLLESVSSLDDVGSYTTANGKLPAPDNPADAYECMPPISWSRTESLVTLAAANKVQSMQNIDTVAPIFVKWWTDQCVISARVYCHSMGPRRQFSLRTWLIDAHIKNEALQLTSFAWVITCLRIKDLGNVDYWCRKPYIQCHLQNHRSVLFEEACQHISCRSHLILLNHRSKRWN